MARFTDKVVIVTGGSAGIGRATALAFAREGARVVIGDILDGPGAEVVSEITRAGGHAAYFHCDVAKEADCRGLVEAAASRFGGLDLAVNNAGLEQSGRPIVECTEADFDRITRINILGVLMGMKHQIPAIQKRGGGTIVNLSSIAGLLGFPGAAVYVASKHAVIGLTRTAALECAKSNIRVNAVCPAAIQTEMIDRFIHHDAAAKSALTAAHPIGRFGRPEEIASVILWLCSADASFVTGQAITADGGYTVQ